MSFSRNERVIDGELDLTSENWPWYPLCDSCEIRLKTESKDGDSEDFRLSMPGSFDA